MHANKSVDRIRYLLLCSFFFVSHSTALGFWVDIFWILSELVDMRRYFYLTVVNVSLPKYYFIPLPFLIFFSCCCCCRFFLSLFLLHSFQFKNTSRKSLNLILYTVLSNLYAKCKQQRQPRPNPK